VDSTVRGLRFFIVRDGAKWKVRVDYSFDSYVAAFEAAVEAAHAAGKSGIAARFSPATRMGVGCPGGPMEWTLTRLQAVTHSGSIANAIPASDHKARMFTIENCGGATPLGMPLRTSRA